MKAAKQAEPTQFSTFEQSASERKRIPAVSLCDSVGEPLAELSGSRIATLSTIRLVAQLAEFFRGLPAHEKAHLGGLMSRSISR